MGPVPETSCSRRDIILARDIGLFHEILGKKLFKAVPRKKVTKYNLFLESGDGFDDLNLMKQPSKT